MNTWLRITLIYLAGILAFLIAAWGFLPSSAQCREAEAKGYQLRTCGGT